MILAIDLDESILFVNPSLLISDKNLEYNRSASASIRSMWKEEMYRYAEALEDLDFYLGSRD
jgi:hypothetical protein